MEKLDNIGLVCKDLRCVPEGYNHVSYGEDTDCTNHFIQSFYVFYFVVGTENQRNVNNNNAVKAKRS